MDQITPRLETLIKTLETGDAARLPVQLAGRLGQIWIESGVRKEMFRTGPTRAAKAGQKSLVPSRRAQRTNQGRTVN